MSLVSILAKIPAAFKQIVPSLLVGVDPSGDPIPIAADADGKMLATTTVSQAGSGWTIEGDTTTVDTSGLDYDVFSLRVGGLAGTVVQTMTVTYSDSTKTQIISTVREIPS